VTDSEVGRPRDAAARPDRDVARAANAAAGGSLCESKRVSAVSRSRARAAARRDAAPIDASSEDHALRPAVRL
jgi:hypothetical protein